MKSLFRFVRALAGNAIDFFVKVLGLSFADTMRHITGT